MDSQIAGQRDPETIRLMEIDMLKLGIVNFVSDRQGKPNETEWRAATERAKRALDSLTVLLFENV